MNRKFQYPLATDTWDFEERQAIKDIVDSGQYTMGKKVVEFERKFASLHGGGHAVMVNSGSSANLLMVAALFYTNIASRKLIPGDEVIVPAISWSTTYFPLAQYGLKIKIVDVDVDTLNISVDEVKKAITKKTKAIFVVNLLGNPSNWKELKELAKEYGLILLEDNCESLGGRYESHACGTFGVMGSFSTFFSHHISTMEGGVIWTEDEELHQIILSLRAHGWTRNLPKNNLIFEEHSEDYFDNAFRFVLPGYNLRPLEISAAIGCKQLDKLSSIINNRRKNAKIWQDLFTQNEYFTIQKETGQSSWFGFSLIAKSGGNFNRPRLRKLLEDNGFECRPIVAGNFAKQPVMKYLNCEVVGDLPNASLIDSNGLFIGNHHYDFEGPIRQIADIIL